MAFLSPSSSTSISAGYVVVNVGFDVWLPWAQGMSFTGAFIGIALTPALPGNPFQVQVFGLVPYNVFKLPGAASTSSAVAGQTPSRGSSGQLIGTVDISGNLSLPGTVVGGIPGGGGGGGFPSIANTGLAHVTGSVIDLSAHLGPAGTSVVSSGTDYQDVGAHPVFNVLAYGAKGDGVTDDTTAIRAAVTAKDAVGGGVVYFPGAPFKFKITGSIDMGTTPTIFQGDRWATPVGAQFGNAAWNPGTTQVSGSCIYQTTANTDGIVLSHAGGSAFMSVRDLAVIGPGSGTGTGFNVTAQSGVVGITLHDVLLANWGTGYNPGTAEESYTKTLWLLGNNLGAQIGGNTYLQGNPSVTFSVGAQTITRSAGSWISDGFANGMTLQILDTVSNNTLATGVVTNVASTVITVASGILANETTPSGAQVVGNNATNDSRNFDFIVQDCNMGLLLASGGGHRFFGGIFQSNTGTVGPCVTFKSIPTGGPRDCSFDSFWMEGSVQTGSGGDFLFDYTLGQMGGIGFKRMHMGEAGAKVFAFTGATDLSGLTFDQVQAPGANITIPSTVTNVSISADSSIGSVDNSNGGGLVSYFAHILSAVPTANVFPYANRIENILPGLTKPREWIAIRQGQAGIVWQPGVNTFAGETFFPPADNGHIYTASQGTTGTTVPVFPTTPGGTVTSGTVTFTEAGPSALLYPSVFVVPTIINTADCNLGLATAGQVVGACQKWTFGGQFVGTVSGGVTSASFILGRPWKRTRIKSVFIDVTTGFAGSGISSIQVSVGDGNATTNYLVKTSLASTGQIGATTSDLGPYLSAPVQGGKVVWAPTSSDDLTIEFYSAGANLNALTLGSLDLFIEFDVLGLNT